MPSRTLGGGRFDAMYRNGRREKVAEVTQLRFDLPISQAIERPRATRRTRVALRTAGLFAGIGGIELGLNRAGHPSVLLCEIDRAARAVLDERFADVAKHADVTKLESLPADTELLAAGFPCQDLSQAGKTAGISGDQSGLVLEVFKLLEGRRVPWVLLENVPFMLQLAKGRALEVVVTNLEKLGYRWAYRVVDARAFGIPQRRERVFFVASLDDDPRRVLFVDDAGPPWETEPETRPSSVACGFYWTEGIKGLGWAVDAVPTLKGGSSVGVPSAPAIWLPAGDIVTPDVRDAERLQGFPADWTKPAEVAVKASFRWKLVGNAVCVPAARWLGERFAEPGDFSLPGAKHLKESSPWPRAAFNMGEGRFAASVSAWPKRTKSQHLLEFLSFPPKPLSARATAGFLARAKEGYLRFPPGFLNAVEAHWKRMEATDGGKQACRPLD